MVQLKASQTLRRGPAAGYVLFGKPRLAKIILAAMAMNTGAVDHQIGHALGHVVDAFTGARTAKGHDQPQIL